jgi:hypothetical protein
LYLSGTVCSVTSVGPQACRSQYIAGFCMQGEGILAGGLSVGQWA